MSSPYASWYSSAPVIMWVQFHQFNTDDQRVAIDALKIESINEGDAFTTIVTGDDLYKVTESYDEVISRIRKAAEKLKP